MFYAQSEAHSFGQQKVSTEHVLLGLIPESDSVAATLLLFDQVADQLREFVF